MKFRIAAGVVGLAVLFAGCASDGRPKVVPVSGKVTQKGKPMTQGEVMFTPTGGVPGAAVTVATGQIESDGSYRLTTFNTGDGAVPGKYKVTVVSRSAGDEMMKMNKKADGTIAYKLPPSAVASKYSSLDTTPLTYTVTDGSNTIDIDLAQ